MKIYLPALLASIFVLSSCASNETIPFAEHAAKYEALKEPVPEHVIIDFHPACNEAGDCIVKEAILNTAAQIVTLLNTTVDKAVGSANRRLDAIMHLEYQIMKLKEANELLEKAEGKCQIISVAKSIIAASACGIILGTM